jgi:hypothetical protein
MQNEILSLRAAVESGKVPEVPLVAPVEEDQAGKPPPPPAGEKTPEQEAEEQAAGGPPPPAATKPGKPAGKGPSAK